MVKPFRVFVYFLLFLLVISTPSFFVSSEGFSVLGVSIKYPDINNLLSYQSQTDSQKAELHPHVQRYGFLIDSLDQIASPDSVAMELDSLITDSIPIAALDSTARIGTKSFNAEALKETIVKLEYPDTTQQALSEFFNALAEGQPKKNIVRVLHYGDSQIEGDRITSYLRQRLQQQFGGSGVGLLHLVPHSYQPAGIIHSNSSNWQKVTLADMGKGTALGNRFGILGGYSIFTSNRGIFSKGGFWEASIQLKRTGSKTRPFNRLRLLFADVSEPFMVSLVSQGKAIEAEMIESGKHLRQLFLGVNPDINSFSVDFKGDASPMFYAMSLEGKVGMQVDNIAIRGSSGTDFTRADPAALKSLFQMLNVKLIILQFGVNLVPHVVSSYDYYENQLYRQIQALKAANPHASIIVIGVSDVARKEGTSFVSYPNIEPIRNAQRNAAQKGGVAFWDCYAAMGGQNSMVAWVNAKPPLASKDYIHFSPRGANLIAEMFYTALNAEFDKFIRTRAEQTKTVTEAEAP